MVRSRAYAISLAEQTGRTVHWTGGKLKSSPLIPVVPAPWERLPEGKKLDTTIGRAQHLARVHGRGVDIIGSKGRPILSITTEGRVEEVLAAPLRVRLGDVVVEQVLNDGHTNGPAARMLQFWNTHHAAAVGRDGALPSLFHGVKRGEGHQGCELGWSVLVAVVFMRSNKEQPTCRTHQMCISNGFVSRTRPKSRNSLRTF